MARKKNGKAAVPTPAVAAATATQPTAASAASAASEIDDIFAAKKSAEPPTKVGQPTASSRDASKSNKTKKQSQPKGGADEPLRPTQDKSEVVVVDYAAVEKAQQAAADAKRPPKGVLKRTANGGDEDDGFADSAGLRATKKKFTDDGYRVYDLDDLGVGKEGGGML
ncbi:hypothetical protein RI367_003645 [Sorochytrium milnesiophthora]